jgi:hypothetical protein
MLMKRMPVHHTPDRPVKPSFSPVSRPLIGLQQTAASLIAPPSTKALAIRAMKKPPVHHRMISAVQPRLPHWPPEIFMDSVPVNK